MADERKDNKHGLPQPSLAIFLGGIAARNLARHGETRPQKALDHAAALRRKGASADTIHAETSKMLDGTPYAGVVYGKDGKPRFEVTDDGARVRPRGLDASGRGYMGDFLEHPELYKALPEAQLLEVQKANFRGGGFDGHTVHLGDNHFSRSMLAGRQMPQPTARGVALHELQHLSQETEGFAPGSNPDDFERRYPGDKNAAVRRHLYDTTAGEVEARNVQTRANMTAAERRRTSPLRTQEYALGEQHLGAGPDRSGFSAEFGGELPKGYHVKRDTNWLGQTNYKIMKGRKEVGNAYVRDLQDRVQVGRISIDKAHQRKGIATALYAQIERDLGKPVVPDHTLSPKAAAFWKKHRPQALAQHRPLGDGSLIIDPYGMFKSEYADTSDGSAARTGEVRRLQRMVEDEPSAGRRKSKAKIEDLGEKIGGARKDTAVKTGRKPRDAAPKVAADQRPAWARRFVAMEQLDRQTSKPTGKWSLMDVAKGSRYGGKVVARDLPSQAAAEAAIPLAAVSRNHRVQANSDGTFSVWRQVSDRKRVQVGDSFPSRESAMLHMAQNAVKIIETKTGFGEEILAPPKPDQVFRTGPAVRKGDVQGQQFIKTFGFRGVEFGNWNNQIERQRVMNHAYDALHDMAEATGLHPRAMSLDGKLALAFGARGTGGQNAARAHYERNFGAINLTKMSGAGSLAHEWMHALDHFLARKDDPSLDQMVDKGGNKVFDAKGRAEDFITHRVHGWVKTKALPAEVRDAAKQFVDTMFTKESVVGTDVTNAQKFVDQAMGRIKDRLDGIRRDLAEQKSYGKRFVAPATPAQLAEFDRIAETIMKGGPALETTYKMAETKSGWGRGVKNVPSSEALDALSALYKQVRGRSGFDAQTRHGTLDYLATDLSQADVRQKMLADAAATSTKTIKVPTDYAMNAKRIDQGRLTDYWTTKPEMAARAFSAFIEDKMKAAGRESGFLSWGSTNDRIDFKMLRVKPFPEGAERTVINAKTEGLLSAIRKSGILPPAPDGGSGLRGTQNPANLAAIIENRQANQSFVDDVMKAARSTESGVGRDIRLVGQVYDTYVQQTGSKITLDQFKGQLHEAWKAKKMPLAIANVLDPAKFAEVLRGRVVDGRQEWNAIDLSESVRQAAEQPKPAARASSPPPAIPKTPPPADVVSMLRSMGAEAHAAGKSSAPALSTGVMKIISEGKYNPLDVMDAYTKGWQAANAAGVPGITDAATKAADIARSDARFQEMLAETDKKIAAHKAAAGPKVQTIEQFAKERGLVTTADVDSHIHANLRSKPASKAHDRRHAKELKRLQDARDATTKAYRQEIASGNIRDYTPEEKLARAAAGHPDNPSVQAAKRVVEKRAARAATESKRYVTLGDGKKMPLGKYVEAWKKAKALPPHTQVRGTPSDPLGGGTAADIVREMRDGMDDRINRHIPGFGKGRKWDDSWQNDARRLSDTLQRRSEVPAGQAHPVDLRPRLAAMGKLEEGTFVPKPGGDRSKANQSARNPKYIPGKTATPQVAPMKGTAPLGFQNEAVLNAALKAQGKAEAGEAKPVTPQRADLEKLSMAELKAKAAEAGVPAARSKQAMISRIMGATGTALGKSVNKLGAISMIAAPAAAAYVAYDATKSAANAAGVDGTKEAVASGAAAAGIVAGIGYGVMKGIQGAFKVAAKVAPKVAPYLGPAGVALGVAGIGYGAYHGYQKGGVKGAALGAVGADVLLDARQAAPAQPQQGRLTPEQQQQFATANAAYTAMKADTASAPKQGWSDEARIAAYVARQQNAGHTTENAPYGGKPRKPAAKSESK